HTEAVGALAEAAGGGRTVPVAASAHPGADVRLADGDAVGPLVAVATPGHAPDHLAFVAGRALLSGDAVLGRGSVFVFPDPGALLREYREHRVDRERRLVEALGDGLRTVPQLLDRVWADAPAALRPAAAVTLAAHLDKLDEEGRLPEGVERPDVAGLLQGA